MQCGRGWQGRPAPPTHLERLASPINTHIEQSHMRPLPKLPAGVFLDASANGPVYMLASLCRELMKAKGLKTVNWQNPQFRRDVRSMRGASERGIGGCWPSRSHRCLAERPSTCSAALCR